MRGGAEIRSEGRLRGHRTTVFLGAGLHTETHHPGRTLNPTPGARTWRPIPKFSGRPIRLDWKAFLGTLRPDRGIQVAERSRGRRRVAASRDASRGSDHPLADVPRRVRPIRRRSSAKERLPGSPTDFSVGASPEPAGTCSRGTAAGSRRRSVNRAREPIRAANALLDLNLGADFCVRWPRSPGTRGSSRSSDRRG